MVPFASYVSRGQSKPRLIFSRINGPIVVKGAGAVILLFHLEYKTSVICHNVNTQKVKLARETGRTS